MCGLEPLGGCGGVCVCVGGAWALCVGVSAPCVGVLALGDTLVAAYDCCLGGLILSWKMCAAFVRASICGSDGACKGPAGWGWRSAWIRSRAALVATSVDDNVGILCLVGKNSTVSRTIGLVLFLRTIEKQR